MGLFGSWFSFLIGRLGCREDAGITETKVELLHFVNRVLPQQARLVQTVCGWSRRYHTSFLTSEGFAHPVLVVPDQPTHRCLSKR